MMTILSVVAVLVTVCCPPTLPMWLFIMVGFPLTLRRQVRAEWVKREGRLPVFGTWGWFVVNC